MSNEQFFELVNEIDFIFELYFPSLHREGLWRPFSKVDGVPQRNHVFFWPTSLYQLQIIIFLDGGGSLLYSAHTCTAHMYTLTINMSMMHTCIFPTYSFRPSAIPQHAKRQNASTEYKRYLCSVIPDSGIIDIYTILDFKTSIANGKCVFRGFV